MIERDMIVICVHGDGDQAHVNAVETAKRANIKREHLRTSQFYPKHLDEAPDQQPEVLVVLRDQHHELRVELPLLTWAEVEEFKAKAGFDAERRHWKHGAVIKVRFG